MGEWDFAKTRIVDIRDLRTIFIRVCNERISTKNGNKISNFKGFTNFKKTSQVSWQNALMGTCINLRAQLKIPSK